MASLKGSQTEKNLLAAFAGESQARNRYTFAAKKAKKAGLLQISNYFIETADNERAHAKRYYDLLEGGMVEITATYPAAVLGGVEEQLAAAAAGEHEEWTEIYPSMAEVAKAEGFAKAAATYKMIAEVEREHEQRFLKLLENVKGGKVFKSAETARWKCLNCGYVAEATEAPALCPACLHSQAYFELLAVNY